MIYDHKNQFREAIVRGNARSNLDDFYAFAVNYRATFTDKAGTFIL